VRAIKGFLDVDHFDMGLHLSNYRLPALATCIALFGDYSLKNNYKGENSMLPACIDPRKTSVVMPKDIAACFAPLMRDEQMLAPGFKLTVVIHSEFNPRDWYGVAPETAHGVAKEVGGDIVAVLEAFKPVVVALRSKCKAEVRFGLNCGTDEVEIKEEQWELDVEGWVGVLEELR
jgi:hypothetical protein